MSKKLFIEKQVNILKNNEYVKMVSSKGITYINEFKIIFVDESNIGKTTRIIFEGYGFHVDILGMRRLKGRSDRWCSALKMAELANL